MIAISSISLFKKSISYIPLIMIGNLNYSQIKKESENKNLAKNRKERQKEKKTKNQGEYEN